MAIIELEEMEFYAYHGCFKEEQVVGNRFCVNIALKVNIDMPAKSDFIGDAVNYVEVYHIIKEEIFHNSHLLENVATRMVDAVSKRFPEIEWIRLKVSKINPPMGGKMKQVSLTIEKELKK